ncbi:MAG: LemA family protein [Sedimentisphaerales bacterium]|nr:LemA family protein [Sedimentisphaerales bacterium]
MWYVLAIVLGVIGLFAILLYNSLVGKKNQVENVFGSIDALLKKRYDLVPNLVATVQQYMKHERDTLTKITELRARAVSGNISDDEKVALDNQITKMLGGIMVAVENYPELKANENFLQLQGSMNEIEEQISAARRAYNASVTDYNNAVEMFPTNIMASMMSYRRKNVFEIPDRERENVNVKELFSR